MPNVCKEWVWYASEPAGTIHAWWILTGCDKKLWFLMENSGSNKTIHNSVSYSTIVSSRGSGFTRYVGTLSPFTVHRAITRVTTSYFRHKNSLGISYIIVIRIVVFVCVIHEKEMLPTCESMLFVDKPLTCQQIPVYMKINSIYKTVYLQVPDHVLIMQY